MVFNVNEIILLGYFDFLNLDRLILWLGLVFWKFFLVRIILFLYSIMLLLKSLKWFFIEWIVFFWLGYFFFKYVLLCVFSFDIELIFGCK